MSDKNSLSTQDEKSKARSRSRQSLLGNFSHSRSRSPISRHHSYSQSHSSKFLFDKHPQLSLNHAARFNPVRNKVLAVFGLDRNVTEQDLIEVYKKYGCERSRIIFDKIVSSYEYEYTELTKMIVLIKTGRSRSFGFVYFNCIEDARKAKHKTHGMKILRKTIRVDYSIGERSYDTLKGYERSRHKSSRSNYEYSNKAYYERQSPYYDRRINSPYRYDEKYSTRHDRDSSKYGHSSSSIDFELSSSFNKKSYSSVQSSFKRNGRAESRDYRR